MFSELTLSTVQLEAIIAVEASLIFRYFTADTAFQIGTQIRNRLRDLTPKPCVVNISLANSNQLLYHACTHPGTVPDNDIWVARKRRTVLRWGCSSYSMHKKFEGNEAEFAVKFALGVSASDYAIHGGGVPVRIQGVEGVVAVIVVSGLKQEDDHMAVVEAMRDSIQEQIHQGKL
ncbi:hypothetical protein MMC19_002488 [Ptychographa xylographoides]|nr:hypothetical protein [Ptychographa xylographoides]